MKKFLLSVGVAFAVSLAVVMGTRMSPDAMAVVVGIVCGVLASVPTTILFIWVTRQRDKQIDSQWQSRSLASFPPVVVVNGQGTNGQNGSYTPPLPVGGITSNGPRNFKVIGQENTETMGDVLPPFWDEL